MRGGVHPFLRLFHCPGEERGWPGATPACVESLGLGVGRELNPCWSGRGLDRGHDPWYRAWWKASLFQTALPREDCGTVCYPGCNRSLPITRILAGFSLMPSRPFKRLPTPHRGAGRGTTVFVPRPMPRFSTPHRFPVSVPRFFAVCWPGSSPAPQETLFTWPPGQCLGAQGCSWRFSRTQIWPPHSYLQIPS